MSDRAYDDDEPDYEYVARNRRKKGFPTAAVAIVGGSAVLVVLAGIALVAKLNAVESSKTRSVQTPSVKQRSTVRPSPAYYADDADDFDERAARRQSAADTTAALGIGLGAIAVYLLLCLAWVAGWAVAAVWVVRDSRARSVDNSFMWGFVTLLFGITTCLGGAVCLALYLASRPNGNLMRCELCGCPRLPYVGVCPHCRRAVEPLGRAGPSYV